MNNIDSELRCEGQTVLVIFGGSGDLTFRKLLPALYNLHVLGAVADGFEVVAVGRRPWTTAEYHEKAKEWARKQVRVPFGDADWNDFTRRLYYHRMELGDLAAYEELDRLLAAACPNSRRVFYYAVAPSWFRSVTQGVVEAGLNRPGSRIILEKPFGDSLEEARELHDELVAAYGEEELYHIDHYLGKEMVRNILWLRFRNAIFRHVWGRHAISDVQINAFEEEGVGSRGGYYDEAGAFRDMVQNHLFQVLSVLAIEPPADETATALHNEQLRVLQALRPVEAAAIDEHLVMGQYEGYREEERVDPESRTPSYAALRLFVDTPRWEGVPFYIRTGKSLHTRDMEIIIRFRMTDPETAPDLLVIKVQPDEGVFLRFNVKQPGRGEELAQVYMDYCQSCHIENYRNTPEAYERLLMAAVNGDQSLFSRWDQIEASWYFANRMIAAWEAAGMPLASYAKGSQGPTEACRLPALDGLDWTVSDLPETSLRAFV
ncbi:MAG: glucose-6-phosphate dehydrogenase [Bacillota bacterium]|nr:glucose-6-phosphate dehydrogenase [Bacillota bacterium]